MHRLKSHQQQRLKAVKSGFVPKQFMGCDAGSEGRPKTSAAAGPNVANNRGIDQCSLIHCCMPPIRSKLRNEPTQAKTACTACCLYDTISNARKTADRTLYDTGYIASIANNIAKLTLYGEAGGGCFCPLPCHLRKYVRTASRNDLQ